MNQSDMKTVFQLRNSKPDTMDLALKSVLSTQKSNSMRHLISLDHNAGTIEIFRTTPKDNTIYVCHIKCEKFVKSYAHLPMSERSQ